MWFLTIENLFDQILTKKNFGHLTDHWTMTNFWPNFFFGQNLVKWVFDGQESHKTTKNPPKPSKTFQNPPKTVQNHPKMTQNGYYGQKWSFWALLVIKFISTNIFPETLSNLESISALIIEVLVEFDLWYPLKTT